MGLRRQWQLLIFFMGVINFNSLLFIEAQTQTVVYWCGDNGNYTANSTYERSIESVVSSIISNIGISGFYNTSDGVGRDQVNAIALCRADVQAEDCRNSIGNATQEFRRLCPMSREAIVWTDFCILRYSNESIFGIETQSPVGWLNNPQNITTIQEFNSRLRLLLEELRGQASADGSLIKAAAGNRPGPDFLTIYGFSQCTPDISADDCRGCLESAAQQIPDCCNGRRGARVLMPSCTLRYEVYPFINTTRLQEVQTLLMPSPPSPSITPLPSPPPAPPSPTGGSRTIIIVVVVVVTSACVVLVGCVFVFLRRKGMKKKHEETTANDEMTIAESLQHDFEQIKAATNDFSEMNELGHGGFGAVYMGELGNGQEIAVKRLSRGSAQGDIEFKNEVLLLAKLQHRNLVRLLGFAARGTERLLIYEFVKNGSLDHFIFDPIKRSEIDWSRRYKIIGGIARGLLYLHEDSRFRIIHRDLKPSNILLDANMNPKIADFGLARLFMLDETQGSTSRVVGTYGYMPPEYAFHGQFSVKLDVYSFGVLVLEIVSGQKNNSFKHGDRTENMLSFAWRCWRKGTAENMVDPILKDGSGSLQDILKCIHIGLMCVQESPADRPTMASVVLMLNSSSITIPIPSRPAFFTPIASDSSSVGYSKSTETDAEQPLRNSASINEVTVSDMYPR